MQVKMKDVALEGSCELPLLVIATDNDSGKIVDFDPNWEDLQKIIVPVETGHEIAEHHEPDFIRNSWANSDGFPRNL